MESTLMQKPDRLIVNLPFFSMICTIFFTSQYFTQVDKALDGMAGSYTLLALWDENMYTRLKIKMNAVQLSRDSFLSRCLTIKQMQDIHTLLALVQPDLGYRLNSVSEFQFLCFPFSCMPAGNLTGSRHLTFGSL